VKKYFITGLLIWIPFGITLWVINLVVTTLDSLLPAVLEPRGWLGVDVPGLGVVLAVAVVFLTGLLTANIIGQRLVAVWDATLARIPFFKSIYVSVKQVSDTLFSSSGQAFRKALLVQYPRNGSWTIAFQTGTPGGDVANHLRGDYVSVYVPTTPNPTSGFFLMMPRSEVIELDMTVDEALKYVISMGVAAPAAPRRASSPSVAEPAPRV
jgi:uncharacterized membrane protein